MNDSSLRDHLVYLLKGGGAHLSFEQAFTAVPRDLRAASAPGIPYTLWRLLEHMRICQWDILEFSRNRDHVSPDWPAGYWPAGDGPPDSNAWNRSMDTFRRELSEMIRLVQDPATDLFARIPWGDGQTILREALLVADHNSYHLGQLVVLLRALGIEPEE